MSKQGVLKRKLELEPANTGANLFKKFCQEKEFESNSEYEKIIEFAEWLSSRDSKHGTTYSANSISTYVQGAVRLNEIQSVAGLVKSLFGGKALENALNFFED